jgi:hypothetical protein
MKTNVLRLNIKYYRYLYTRLSFEWLLLSLDRIELNEADLASLNIDFYDTNCETVVENCISFLLCCESLNILNIHESLWTFSRFFCIYTDTLWDKTLTKKKFLSIRFWSWTTKKKSIKYIFHYIIIIKSYSSKTIIKKASK